MKGQPRTALPRAAGVLRGLVVLLVVAHLAAVASGRRVHSKRYSETATQQAAQTAQAPQTLAPEEDEDYDEEAEDDERVYKNPRNSPSAVCPRDEEHANFLGQTCLRKCSSDEDCKSKKKKCRCDGTCGMSCIKPDRECPDLDPLPVGNVTTTGRFFGDTATYACEMGFHLVGLRVRSCQADGHWSGQQPTCKNVYCRTPPPMDHARHNALQLQTTFDVGTTLKYQCHSGYVTNGFPTAKCLAMGGSASWFGPDISCEPRTCGQPADPENGWHKASCYTYTCRATYECAKEYELVGRAERTCQADGTWSPKDLPTCVLVAEVECPAPENPVNGRAIYTRQAYNSVVSYECNYGYSLVGDATRKCGADRRWSGHKPACQEINCGDPGPLYNGWLENLEGGTGLGASVIFRCKEGTRLEGNSSSVCQIDGHWRYPSPRCMAPCVVPKIINGTVKPRGVSNNTDDLMGAIGADGAQTVQHGEQLVVHCEPRYEFLNNGTPVTCNNGTWTQIPKCQPARCKRMPRAPRNGYVIAPKTDHGMRARFACRDGYTLNGTDVTECSYGNWSNEVPLCDEVYCPFPGYVENGKVMLVGNMGLYDYRPYVRKVTNNKQIMYDCDRGYVLAEGPPGATCIGGEWSPQQLPKCVPGKHPRLRWSRSVRRRRAALFAARLKMMSSPRWSADSDNNESNHVSGHRQHTRLTAATPAPSVEFQPWGAPVMDHDNVQDSSAMQPSAASRDMMARLLGKNLSPDSHAASDSASVAGDPEQSYSDTHPLYGRAQPAHNGADGPRGMPRLVSWFTADGRTREHARAERARRAALHQDPDHEDDDDDEEEDSNSASATDEASSSSSSSSSSEESLDHHAVTTAAAKTKKNETVLSRQARASRTRVGPQVMRANRHRGGDRRKSTKTRKDSTKKTSPGNTVTCEALATDQYTHVVVTKPGRDHNDSASSGSTVQVSCEVGYQLSIGANQTAKCVRGRWKPAKPECIIVPCRIPETEHAIYRRVNDSTLLIEDTEVSSDEEVKFSCINGYNPVGALRFRCKHGEWDVSELPWCEPGEDTHYRGSDSGSDIDLFGEVDKGDRRSCNPPSKVQGSLVYVNGHPIKDSDINFPDGTEVTFNCMASIMGEKSTWRVLCEDGTWLGRSLSCDMEDLADSKMRDNTTCTLRSTEPNVVSFHNDQLITVDVVELPAGAVVVSRCRDIGKYQLIGSSHRRCVSGEWDGQKPVCFGLNQENDYALEKPPTILFRHRLGPIAQSNDGKLIVYPGVVLHMECLWIRRFGTPKWSVNHSYSSNNSAVIVLTDSLNSTNATDTPQKVYPTGWNSEDGRDSALEYRLSILHASQDDSGEFTCTTPTRHTHAVTIEVKAVNCPKLPEKRGLVYSATHTKMNSRVSMSCPGGNSLIGASEIVCLASGNWSAPFPVCESVECADFGVGARPAVDANLRVSILSRGVGGQAVFSCPAGFGLVGPTHSVCQANGEWAGPYPTCKVVNCEAPGTPDHGYTTGQGPPYRAGDIVQFNCNPQFMMEGQPIIACQENGRWSGSVPKCVQACSYPGTAISGRMSDVKFYYKIGETVTFDCDVGLEIRGVSMLRCMRNGKWSNAIPVCVPAGSGGNR
ncbi:uncharacterized protein LOC117646517 isoform X1 [Thrips palmi]|uniref:Uncharacterized protein LOC117646517 isoform X1 n=1 Tax=Thrips palmi TaxID=161013 RepID=A0A6P8YTP4_THRPL|nr:uncharacterized protein LOC117646517 isoform X1 [Thrips palmi]